MPLHSQMARHKRMHYLLAGTTPAAVHYYEHHYGLTFHWNNLCTAHRHSCNVWLQPRCADCVISWQQHVASSDGCMCCCTTPSSDGCMCCCTTPSSMPVSAQSAPCCCTHPAQLLLWGWRVPFLLTAFTAPIALLLRMHMVRRALPSEHAATVVGHSVHLHVF
jgi:hypothetical protein